MSQGRAGGMGLAGRRPRRSPGGWPMGGAAMMSAVKFAGLLGLVMLAWTGVLAMLAFTAKPGAPLAILTLPGKGVAVAAAAGGSYESLGGPVTITRSSEDGFIGRLYRAGALMVIDARVVIACRGPVGKS